MNKPKNKDNVIKTMGGLTIPVNSSSVNIGALVIIACLQLFYFSTYMLFLSIPLYTVYIFCCVYFLKLRMSSLSSIGFNILSFVDNICVNTIIEYISHI